MEKTVTEAPTYTAIELAELRLPGFPASRKNWYELVAREQWRVVEKPGKGPGGLRREYVPPAEVQAMIEAVLRGETPPARERRKQAGSRMEQAAATVNDVRIPIRGPELSRSIYQQKSGRLAGTIDYLLLRRCFSACLTAYGPGFEKVPLASQLKCATDFYNVLIGMAVNMKGGISAFQQLDVPALVEQLRLLLQMAVIKPWNETSALVAALETATDSMAESTGVEIGS